MLFWIPIYLILLLPKNNHVWTQFYYLQTIVSITHLDRHHFYLLGSKVSYIYQHL